MVHVVEGPHEAEHEGHNGREGHESDKNVDHSAEIAKEAAKKIAKKKARAAERNRQNNIDRGAGQVPTVNPTAGDVLQPNIGNLSSSNEVAGQTNEYGSVNVVQPTNEYEPMSAPLGAGNGAGIYTAPPAARTDFYGDFQGNPTQIGTTSSTPNAPAHPQSDGFVDPSGGTEMRNLSDNNNAGDGGNNNNNNNAGGGNNAPAPNPAEKEGMKTGTKVGLIIGVLGVVGVVVTLVVGATTSWFGLASDDEETNPDAEPVTKKGATAEPTTGQGVVGGGRVAQPTTVLIDISDNGNAALTQGSVKLYKALMGGEAEDSLKVDGEGTWTVGTGDKWQEITFTPEAGYSGDPSLIYYTVTNESALISNRAAISVIYDDAPALTSRGVFYYRTSRIDVTEILAAGDTVSLYKTKDEAGVGVKSLPIDKQGTWDVVVDAGITSITYTPIAKATGAAASISHEDPTPVFYKITTSAGKSSDAGLVEVFYAVRTPIVIDDIVPDYVPSTQVVNGVTVGVPYVISVLANEISRDYAINYESFMFHSLVSLPGVTPPTGVKFESKIEVENIVLGYTKITIPGEGVWDTISETVKINEVDTVITSPQFTPEPTFKGVPTMVRYSITDVEANRSNLAVIILNKHIGEIQTAIQAMMALDDVAFWADIKAKLVTPPNLADLEVYYGVINVLESATWGAMDDVQKNLADSFAINPNTVRIRTTEYDKEKAKWANSGDVTKLFELGEDIKTAQDSVPLVNRFVRLRVMRQLSRDYFAQLAAILSGLNS